MNCIDTDTLRADLAKAEQRLRAKHAQTCRVFSYDEVKAYVEEQRAKGRQLEVSPNLVINRDHLIGKIDGDRPAKRGRGKPPPFLIRRGERK